MGAKKEKEQAMKLCPLFESIEHEPQLELHVAPEAQQRHFFRGVAACNAKLSREAIEAAIHALECNIAEIVELSCVESVDDLSGILAERASVLQQHIEQLRAMLPEGEG